MAAWERPAPAWLVADPMRLEDAQRALAANGVTAALSLRSDGILVVESDADPGDLAALVAVRSAERDADDADRDVLRAYLDTPPLAVTPAQREAAFRTLIRVTGRLARAVR